MAKKEDKSIRVCVAGGVVINSKRFACGAVLGEQLSGDKVKATAEGVTAGEVIAKLRTGEAMVGELPVQETKEPAGEGAADEAEEIKQKAVAEAAEIVKKAQEEAAKVREEAGDILKRAEQVVADAEAEAAAIKSQGEAAEATAQGGKPGNGKKK